MTTTRATLLMQAAILGILAALSLRDPATININVTGQSVTVAAPSTTGSTEAERQRLRLPTSAAPLPLAYPNSAPMIPNTSGPLKAIAVPMSAKPMLPIKTPTSAPKAAPDATNCTSNGDRRNCRQSQMTARFIPNGYGEAPEPARGRGWVQTLPYEAGTGGGSRAQDTPEIMFSVSNE